MISAFSLGKLFSALAPASFKPYAGKGKAGTRRNRPSHGKRLVPALRGGTFPAWNGPLAYLTYAETDRICRKVLSYGRTVPNRKAYREDVAEQLLCRRQSGAA